MQLRAFSPPKKSHQLVEQLLAPMRSGAWAPGVRLPSERALSLEYGVSRTAVREALSALQLAGYIETRVGDGSFVARAPAGSSEHDDPNLLAGLNIAEMLEAREALEAACGFLAIRKASRTDVARLKAKVRQLEERAAACDYKAYLATTLEVHVGVAVAAHSPLLFRLVKQLLERHRRDQWLLCERYTPQAAQRSLRVHKALVDAICKRDTAAMLAAIREHYEHYPILQTPGAPLAIEEAPSDA